MKNSRIRKKVLEVTIHDIQKEMTVLCSIKTRSMLRDSTPEAVNTFHGKLL